MAHYPEDIQSGLEKMGFSSSSLERVRLARGVVGKASYVACATVMVLGVVAFWLRDPNYLLLLGVLVVFVFALYFGGSLWFANKHPDLALLEGAELIQWRQIDMAAKGVSSELIAKQSQPVLVHPRGEEG